METAGKQVDDGFTELMKENGMDVRQREQILSKRFLSAIHCSK
jgi:hypothetical protein